MNGWSRVKNSHFDQNVIKMLQALQIKIFLTPYYSSSRGLAILLYESLRQEKNYLELNNFRKLIEKNNKISKNRFFHFFTFFKNCAYPFSKFWPRYIHRLPPKPSPCHRTYFTLPGNKIISTFECMEQSQKLTFWSKSYQNVASPPDEDFPDTVLLFEPRISYPALRVTPTEKNYQIK